MFCFGKKPKSKFEEINDKVQELSELSYKVDQTITDFMQYNGYLPEFLVLNKEEFEILHEYFSGRFVDEDTVKRIATKYSRWKSQPTFAGCKILIDPKE